MNVYEMRQFDDQKLVKLDYCLHSVYKEARIRIGIQTRPIRRMAAAKILRGNSKELGAKHFLFIYPIDILSRK